MAEPKLLHRLKGHRYHIYAVAFSPDSSRAVTGSLDQDLRLWRTVDGTQIAEMKGHSNKVHSVAIASDGTIASGDESGEIRLWDGRDGHFLRVLAKQKRNAIALSFSPDGKLLLSGFAEGEDAYECHIYDVVSGHKITSYTGHDNTVRATAFSPDGQWAATGGGNNKEIHLWDPYTGDSRLGPKGDHLRLGGQGRAIWAAGFSSDGQRIGWGTDWRQEDPALGYGPIQQALMLSSVDSEFGAPAALTDKEANSFDRALITFGVWSLQHHRGSADNNVREGGVLDIMKDGGVQASIARGVTTGFSHKSYSFTRDGKTIISGGAEGALTAYDRDGKVLGAFVGHEGDIWAVTPSRDGRFLLSGSSDQTVRLWNLNTRELLVTLFCGRDGEWLMWTPEGFYTGSEGSSKMVGWQINQGPNKEARYVTAGQFRKLLYRPVIGRISFRLNGQEREALYGALVLDKQRQLTFRFNLAKADTEIEVTATDKTGQVLSLPARVTVHADPKAILGVPDLYVLAIGADRYRDLSKRLNFAVKDAEALAETLKEAGAGFYRHSPIVKTLFDDEVTAEKVEAAFKELGATVRATDVFLFYMAGHGKTITAEGDYYFIPPATEGFSDADIKAQGFGPAKLSSWFKNIQAEKSIWIFDTCESGSAGSLFRARDATADDAAYLRLKDATGRTLFMAAGPQQIAAEGYRNHGLFTYALLEGLAKAGVEDKVQLYDLAGYVQSRVPDLSRELKVCDAKGPREYCQKPIVRLGETPNYPLAPRYLKVLAMLGADAPQISTKPTHVVMQETPLLANRGATATRQMKPGEQVTVLKFENDLAQIAEDGKLLGFVDKAKLLRLLN
ncbi:MAG: caspase family protein [Rhodomicrobium sp.]